MDYKLQTSGGGKMQKALNDILRRAGKRDVVNVGFLEGATYPTGVSTEDLRKQYAERKKKGITGAVPSARGGQSVASVAAANEFGVPAHKQPPRPFFRSMVKAKSPDWGRQLGKVLVAADYDADVALGRMGELMAGQLRQSIIETNSPPLKASTIARKGFAKPLVDTGHMLQSVDYEVK